MQITGNTTPYPADLFVFTDKGGQKHCVVIVKATFDVMGSGDCVASDEQAAIVYTDEHHGDPSSTAISRESDFAPAKVHAEILVRGDAVAPGGRPVTQIEVSLARAGHVKRAIVTGDQTWVRRGARSGRATRSRSCPCPWLGTTPMAGSIERTERRLSMLRNGAIRWVEVFTSITIRSA